MKIFFLFLFLGVGSSHLKALASDTDDSERAGFKSTVFLLTTSKSKNTTQVHLINTSSKEQTFSGTLYDHSGSLMGDRQRPLNESLVHAGERLIFSAEDIELIFGVNVVLSCTFLN